ncbi:prolipoprotein diacylglyceryl transferase [Glacieibacterium sp.]|uniref:prolipoprotein diacylglyceryl transferase n=1 Tax=Glacieibacterium sp. TaxID=2860237 RepID=UPI003B00D29F
MLGQLHVAVDFATLGLSPELFSIGPFGGFGPFALRWYSLAYIGGILLGWYYLTQLLKRPGAPMTRVQADDFITWATLGIIIGGRLGYVLFYNLDQYVAHPMEVFRLWDGGMSFHGGALGTTVAILVFARRNGLSFLRICDYVACVAPIGQGLGRLANFVNGELWGRPTGTDWGIIFPGGGPLARHPSQLYEAFAEGLVLLLVLSWMFWRTDARLRPGLLVGVGCGAFGLFRFIIEFFREPDAQVGYLTALHLTMGQILCFPMILLGIALVIYSQRAPRAA